MDARVADQAGLAALRMRRVLDAESDREAVLASFLTGLTPGDEQLLRDLLGRGVRAKGKTDAHGGLRLPAAGPAVDGLADRAPGRAASASAGGDLAADRGRRVLAVCSTLCLALLMVVGTAQLPGNPLPDGWSDPEVREAVPYDEVAGKAAIPALVAVLAGVYAGGVAASAVCAAGPNVPLRDCRPRPWRCCPTRSRTRTRCRRQTGPDRGDHRDAGPGSNRPSGGRCSPTSGPIWPRRHHRFLLTVQLAARANPFLRPLRTAVTYTAERWADEEAARAIGSRRTVARAIGKAALVSRGAPIATLAGFAAAGPVPRRVAALLGPAPAGRIWPPVFTTVGLAAWGAAAGTTVSALSSANSAVTLFLILQAATPM